MISDFRCPRGKIDISCLWEIHCASYHWGLSLRLPQGNVIRYLHLLYQECEECPIFYAAKDIPDKDP